MRNLLLQELLQLHKSDKVAIKYKELTSNRYIDSWIINHCINCSMDTHAVRHENQNAIHVFVSSKLRVKTISAFSLH